MTDRPHSGLALLTAAMLTCFAVWAEEQKPVAGQADPNAPIDQKLPQITITAKKPAVEQGERSLFQGLPPRDLMERPITESPGLDTATTIVSKEEIRLYEAFSLVDALQYVPGAWTESRGRKVKQFFSIRGQRYPYPGYMIDGAWFREFEEINYFFSAAMVDRIELLRSSAALLHGPGGMTGMVNIVPKTYSKRQTEVYGTYGSNDTYRGEIGHGDTFEKTSYAVGIGQYHTDGGDDHMNAGEKMSSLYGRISHKLHPQLTLSLSTFAIIGDRELKVARPPASANLQTREQYFDPMRTYLLVGKARYEPSDRYATEVVLNAARRKFYGHWKGQPDWIEKDHEYGARITQSAELFENNTLRVSAMGNHWIAPEGKRFYVGRRGDLATIGGAIVDEHDFGRLKLNAGYRVSRTYVNDFGGFSVEGSSAGLRSVEVHNEWEDPLHTLSAGGSYQLTDTWSLHANVTWGQIDARRGALTDSLARPDNEERTKYDLGIKREWDGFGEVMLTGFYVRQKDAPILSGAVVTVRGEDFALYENADRESYGLELDVRSKRFASGLQFFANGTLMQTRQEAPRAAETGERIRDREVPARTGLWSTI